MKIKLKLNTREQLIPVLAILNTYDFSGNNPVSKSFNSILSEVKVLLTQKYYKTGTKPFTVNLKYYQAFTLQNILVSKHNFYKNDSYEYNALTIIINQINKEL